MVTDTTAHSNEEGSSQVPSSRFAVAVSGALVAIACLGYAAWSLLAGRLDTDRPGGAGITLAIPSPAAPAEPAPLPQEPTPSARLFLDEGGGLSELPVVNAHLEVPLDNSQPAAAELVAPAIRQLGFGNGPAPDADQPVDDGGARLSGTIEALPD